MNLERLQLLGTGLWDDPAMARDASLAGAWYAAPDDRGFKSFAERYRAKFGADPVRTASLAYDATALAAALVKTQGADGLTDETLHQAVRLLRASTAPFRFRADGGTDRGLAVYRVQAGGATMISPPPRASRGQTRRPRPSRRTEGRTRQRHPPPRHAAA